MVDCDGQIYVEKGKVRSPVKVMPVSPLSRFIAHLSEDEAVIEHLQDWRDPEIDREEDPYCGQHQPVNPVPPADFSSARVMKGKSDGLSWRSQVAYAKRNVRMDGSVEEVVEGPCVFRHSALKYGLKIILNLDWYVDSFIPTCIVTNQAQSYLGKFSVAEMPGFSVGGLYASIANLPRDMCLKPRYSALLAVLPGPGEPSLSDINKVLEPVVKDLQVCALAICINEIS